MNSESPSEKEPPAPSAKVSSSMPIDFSSRASGGDTGTYILAAVCGVIAGIADVAVNDLLFTALLVLAACMMLGTLRARQPWRWVIVVVIFIPLAELASYVVMSIRASRAQIYGGFLTALPGIAGAYGGAVMRRVIDNLREGK
jgi:ABC-type multidrug transport system permease subunit